MSQVVSPEVTTGLFIGGESIAATDTFPVYDPADVTSVVGHAAKATTEQAKAAVRAARAAFPAWSALTPHERAELIIAALEPLPADHDERALLLSQENGKTVFESGLDIQVLAARFHLAAGLADLLSEPRTIDGKPLPQAPLSFHTTVERVAIGVRLAHRAVQLADGHPRRVAALRARRGQHDDRQGAADDPPCRSSDAGDHRRTAAARRPQRRLGHRRRPRPRPDSRIPRSTRSRSPAASAPASSSPAMAAESLTRVSLELGGNDPAIFLEDADLSGDAFHRIDLGAFLTTGQVCMAAKRVYVHESRYGRARRRPLRRAGQAPSGPRPGRGHDDGGR